MDPKNAWLMNHRPRLRNFAPLMATASWIWLKMRQEAGERGRDTSRLIQSD
jgi:hypothetical protein